MKQPALSSALIVICFALTARGEDGTVVEPDVVASVLQPVFQKSCIKCHGKADEPEGEVNLLTFTTTSDLTAQPALIESLIEVLDSGYMPPEDEPPLALQTRHQLVSHLQVLLRDAVRARKSLPRAPIRRMNRFQYSNAVQDLFELNVVVFPLPERMLREHGNYFQPQTGKMPDVVKAGSRPLGKSQLIEKRLGGVTPFPQDLRAENGFDNRGDHLSLSPLLLESFLRLSRSIVESRDLDEKTCGIWQKFFARPQTDIETAVRDRLQVFLTRAFRRPATDEQLTRYTTYVLGQIAAGTPFVDSMKGAAAAALASPQFFYLYDGVSTESGQLDEFDLATRMSFFLWGSLPDQTLLDLAATGTLHEPDVLAQQVERMLGDRRLKRFCDSFPAQWLQLEHIISSTPDPATFPQFYFSKYRASMHMMLEPLLLFETLLIEDHSILKLIDSDFSYRSDLLSSWYRDGSQGKAGSPVSVTLKRVPIKDRRQGGIMTTAAVMTMTSGTLRTKPITRGAWVASVILNDPPEPPPADVPPLIDKPSAEEENLTLRERFAAHRKRPDCAGCHQRIDPLGFAFENYNPAGIWRDEYDNGRQIDTSGTLFGRHEFTNVVEFKDALLAEKDRFTRAFASHVLAFALGRETAVEDSLALDRIVAETSSHDYRIQSLIKQVVLSESFLRY